MSSRDLQAVVKTQKAFIKELLDRLERKENEDSIIVRTVKQCVKDGYFNGLTLEQIFELAKKSIRLTEDNCDLRHKLEDISLICSECKCFSCCEYENTKQCNSACFWFGKSDILQKIKNIIDK